MKTLMSSEKYHLDSAIGSTTLKDVASKSVLHALRSFRPPSPALDFGSGVHAAVLEPETFREGFAIAPNVDKRTKAGKAEFAEFAEKAKGKTILTSDQFDSINHIIEAIEGNDMARGMLSGGESEYSYFCEDAETGTPLKCRPDYVNQGSLIDLKTTEDASPEKFLRSIINFGYHIQAAFYLDVYNKANSTNLKEFYFIAVEKKAPFGIGIYSLDEEALEVGRILYRKALNSLHEFNNSTKPIEHFGYSQSIVELNLPIWALDKAYSKIEGEL